MPRANQSAPVNVTGSGTTVIAAAVGAQFIRISKLMFSASPAVDFKLQTVNAQGVAKDLTGVFKNVATFSYDFEGELQTDVGSSLAINISTASNLGGYLTYFEQS